ncbi:RNA polymerase sigma factor [Streptomyces iconiensis]|uniref:RNA polymerase sigma factor n=1 Tax=Streptomyces iconiensis TaxID=1384038 RepID=A0ABT6ZNW5_9ACTN|nr:RNA polymerase sigma factor [Streptomyces iconiensis]MDJ1130747.1 RNA polymerase sigma factor [Streptomyces iconiensis]
MRDGDKEAFAALYDAYARAVYNHAFRLTGDWSAAEEVMGETFLVAWRTRAKVEPEGGPLRPWLLGIATNKARNHRRGVGRRLAFLASQPRPRDLDDFAEAAAAHVDGQRELAAVGRALGQLRHREREVLALCVWAELDYAQAAEALGVAVGTVRSRLSRARTRLRHLAAQQLAEHPAHPAHPDRSAHPARSAREEREPGRGRGEVIGKAALAALPVEEEAR